MHATTSPSRTLWGQSVWHWAHYVQPTSTQTYQKTQPNHRNSAQSSLTKTHSAPLSIAARYNVYASSPRHLQAPISSGVPVTLGSGVLTLLVCFLRIGIASVAMPWLYGANIFPYLGRERERQGGRAGATRFVTGFKGSRSWWDVTFSPIAWSSRLAVSCNPQLDKCEKEPVGTQTCLGHLEMLNVPNNCPEHTSGGLNGYQRSKSF